jgi:hypothetical protein
MVFLLLLHNKAQNITAHLLSVLLNYAFISGNSFSKQVQLEISACLMAVMPWKDPICPLPLSNPYSPGLMIFFRVHKAFKPSIALYEINMKNPVRHQSTNT